MKKCPECTHRMMLEMYSRLDEKTNLPFLQWECINEDCKNSIEETMHQPGRKRTSAEHRADLHKIPAMEYLEDLQHE